MRRQNRSCDQCRRSKRACDPASGLRRGGIGAQRLGFPNDETADNGRSSQARLRQASAKQVLTRFVPDMQGLSQPCSYCVRTLKDCTYVWARAQVQSAKTRRDTAGGASLSNQSNNTKRRRTSTASTQKAYSAAPDTGNSNPAGESQFTQPTFQKEILSSLNVDQLWFDELLAPVVVDDACFPVSDDILRLDMQENLLPEIAEGSDPDGRSLGTLSPFPGFSGAWVPAPEPSGVFSGTTRGRVANNFNDEDEVPALCIPGQNYANRQHHYRRASAVFSASPTLDQVMAVQTNQHMISESLLRIYHDVLEHNLCCWLTEATCPYSRTMTAVSRGGRRIRYATSEQGATWSNRIYFRVLRLDRHAASTNQIQLTRSEDRAASTALHLAIMAFSSQWAQGSRREREQYGMPQRDGAGTEHETLAEEFDRNIQISLWEQAKKALQDVSDVECFRVACAEMIFGLCQRPWDLLENIKIPAPGHNNSTSASLMRELQAAISKDGTPFHIERAARRMRALKYHWDSHKTGVLSLRENDAGDTPLPPTASSAGHDEHQETVGLLFWLAVMFDTVSSSMNERPVVVADEDSQHHDASASPSNDDPLESRISPQNTARYSCKASQPPNRWSVSLFIQDDLEGPTQAQHWPCSYEAATAAVNRSAPVKVLLFRHVSWLQNALRKGQKGDAIEEIISSTTSLYRYWNVTYGAFFRDLVRYFPSVPLRIQGWFFCISAHWHLGAFMFADLVDFVDRHGLGVWESSQARVQSNMVRRILKASADEMADLANVATPQHEAGPGTEPVSTTVLPAWSEPGSGSGSWIGDDGTNCSMSSGSQPPSPNLHFAVNQCTVLTEPWTVLLIRALTRAGAVHVAQAEDLWRTGLADLGHGGETCEESLRRCEECIRALWFLGKKSDMARSTANILSRALSQVSQDAGLAKDCSL